MCSVRKVLTFGKTFEAGCAGCEGCEFWTYYTMKVCVALLLGVGTWCGTQDIVLEQPVLGRFPRIFQL